MRRLLQGHEPPAVSVEREDSRAPFFVVCDHASNRIPDRLGRLGLDDVDLHRHIAWDIGAAGVARGLAEELDATLVLQNYSRLVVDCNRPLDHEELIPVISEATRIPANAGLEAVEREARRAEIFAPYHDCIRELLAQRELAGLVTLFVSVHSFTPVYLGERRVQDIGVLHDRDARVARWILEMLRGDPRLCVGDNEPYSLGIKDYGIPVHAEDRGLPHVLFEIRQDLIATAAGQRAWAARLAPMLRVAVARLAAGA